MTAQHQLHQEIEAFKAACPDWCTKDHNPRPGWDAALFYEWWHEAQFGDVNVVAADVYQEPGKPANVRLWIFGNPVETAHDDLELTAAQARAVARAVAETCDRAADLVDWIEGAPVG